MEDYNYSVKDLYQGMLLAGQDMIINGVQYKKNDILFYFDNIQEAIFQENVKEDYASGGYSNRKLINWESTESVSCILKMGKISKFGYGLINSQVLNSVDKIKCIRQLDKTLVKNGVAYIKHTPFGYYPIQVFEIKEGAIVGKILDFEAVENTIIIDEKYNNKEIIVDYYFNYNLQAKIITIGEKNLCGTLKFVGRFYYSDEKSGLRKTGLIEIPSLEINGNFSINFNRQNSPLVNLLKFTAIPSGDRNNSKTVEIIYLDEDIDSDF